MSDRYDTSDNPEGRFQQGSNEQVLINKLGITDPTEMENAEYDALIRLEKNLLEHLAIDTQISAPILRDWHQNWLGPIYEWAGEYRSVNLSKGDFIFAAAHLIPKLMASFEQKILSLYTPCCDMDEAQLVEAMAKCHVEFIIIHPFREGNGRMGRVLTTVMALQANMPLLDFDLLEREKSRYILAIHAGHVGNYEPMKLIFSEILDYSILQFSQNESDD